MKLEFQDVGLPISIAPVSRYQVGVRQVYFARCHDCGREEFADGITGLNSRGWSSIDNRRFCRLLFCPACVARLKHQCNAAVIDAIGELVIQHGLSREQAVNRLNTAIENNEITFLDGSVVFENLGVTK